VSDLTVFIGTFNRTDTLARCILNLHAQSVPLRIVVVDNGSKDEAAIAYLDDLSSRYKVYRLPPNEEVETTEEHERAHGGRTMSAVQLNYSVAMRKEWDLGFRTRWYAVCDCDTAPENPYSVSHYIDLASDLGVAVGPHLRLNVHRNYPLRTLALVQGARVLFKERMQWHEGIPYSLDDIDSTFHLFPAAPEFKRLQMRTARVGGPYWTTHTDWLFDALNPTDENHAYILGSSAAASWTGNWMREWFRAWLRSPEEAFSLVAGAVRTHEDYWPEGFILSWMLQYGHGCEQDLEWSKLALIDAVPGWSPCLEYYSDWDALVYENDQSCLGW
jgi:glycosyltransferase involved in cell wall biosynthesis